MNRKAAGECGIGPARIIGMEDGSRVGIHPCHDHTRRNGKALGRLVLEVFPHEIQPNGAGRTTSGFSVAEGRIVIVMAHPYGCKG